jgi:hypothetical protein
VSHVCEWVIVTQRGRAVESLTAIELAQRRAQDPYTQRLTEAAAGYGRAGPTPSRRYDVGIIDNAARLRRTEPANRRPMRQLSAEKRAERTRERLRGPDPLTRTGNSFATHSMPVHRAEPRGERTKQRAETSFAVRRRARSRRKSVFLTVQAAGRAGGGRGGGRNRLCIKDLASDDHQWCASCIAQCRLHGLEIESPASFRPQSVSTNTKGIRPWPLRNFVEHC